MTVSFIIFSQSVFAQENGRLPSLDELIEEALKANPEIKSAERRWLASEERPRQVSTLPDPMFSYSRYGSSVETRVGSMDNAFILSQKLPFPGKLGLKGKMAAQDAAAEMQNYEAAKRDVTFKVKSAYYDLYWIDQSIAIINNYLTLLQSFTQVAEQKYATGRGIQANVLKSQVEISSTIERRLSFEKHRQGVVARMNALLSRSQNSSLDVALQIDTTRISLDETTLVRQALEQREELQAVDAMVDKSEFMRQLAKKNYLPDLNLQANYIDISKGVSSVPDAGKNAWSIMFGVNLPIWFGKQKAAVREAEEVISSNKLMYEDLENRIRAEIRDIYYQIEIIGQTLDLYEQGLISQAESSLESATASYRTGTLDFLSLLDAERMLLNLKLGYTRETSNYQKQLAALERSVGGTLPQ
jgi:outer membrane protein TolC